MHIPQGSLRGRLLATDKRQRYDQHGHAGVDGVHQFNEVEDIFDAFGDLFDLSLAHI